jgi:hypothetical protein
VESEDQRHWKELANMTTEPVRHPASAAPQQQGARHALLALRPVLAWALVVMAAMLFYFVQLVREQVERGERLHAAQRNATVASPAQRPTTPKNRQERVVASLP